MFSKTKYGFHVYTGDEKDSVVQRSIREHGDWDSSISNWMMQNVQPGWTCLDIGVNVGLYTGIMALKAGPTGKVFGFEASSRLVEKYEESVTLSDRSKFAPTVVYPYALSDSAGEKQLFIESSNIGAGSFNPVRKTDHIEIAKTVTLDSVLPNEKIDFIKIDVEGHEEYAWAGFSEGAKKCPLILAELGVGQSDDFLDMIFETYEVDGLGYPNDVRAYVNNLKRSKNNGNFLLKLKV